MRQQSWLWRLLLLNELYQCSCWDLSSNILVHLGTSWYILVHLGTHCGAGRPTAPKRNTWLNEHGTMDPQKMAVEDHFLLDMTLFKHPVEGTRSTVPRRSTLQGACDSEKDWRAAPIFDAANFSCPIVCYGTSKQSLEVNHLQMGHGFHSYVKLSDGNLQLSAD